MFQQIREHAESERNKLSAMTKELISLQKDLCALREDFKKNAMAALKFKSEQDLENKIRAIEELWDRCKKGR